MAKSKKLFLPLYAIEAYLLFSLLLLNIGPLHFNLHNNTQFIVLITAYHLMFILGYKVGIRKGRGGRTNIFYGNDAQIRQRFSLLIILVIYIWIVVTRNVTHASSYLPIEFFQKAISGLLNPASRYYSNKGSDASELFNGNKFVTGSVLLIYFLYYCFPALTVMYWKKISRIQKIFSVVLIFLCILQGFSTGTNASIFHIVFSLAGGVLIILSTKSQYEVFFGSSKKNDKRKRRAKRIVIFAIVLGVLYFVYNINTRLAGETIEYFVSKSPDISLSKAYEGAVDNSVLGPYVRGLASIQSYICQGYYGMSLAINKGFTSTYGIGHSFFLATSFDNMFGTSIIDHTYQEKITDLWSRTVNWHSFYSQMANDVSFYGVIIIMFLLGIIIAKVWRDIIDANNPIAKLFMVVLIPVFIFMPMNNQMGNLYGTFFSFWELFFIWIITRNYAIKIGKIKI